MIVSKKTKNSSMQIRKSTTATFIAKLLNIPLKKDGLANIFKASVLSKSGKAIISVIKAM
ncbi:hypothetical protein J4401_01080 [Candidatus Woesearchaeota archaeon]|nr:hypothetical protein [Candidatus Woesearchaeota archaeon]